MVCSAVGHSILRSSKTPVTNPQLAVCTSWIGTPSESASLRRMLLGGRSEGPIEPGVGAEDFSQHLAMDTVMALRPLAGRKERHVVEAIACERDAHISHALGVAAQFESQAVRAADEASRTARHHEALATKLGKDRLGYN